jgi:hypothetical protein
VSACPPTFSRCHGKKLYNGFEGTHLPVASTLGTGFTLHIPVTTVCLRSGLALSRYGNENRREHGVGLAERLQGPPAATMHGNMQPDHVQTAASCNGKQQSARKSLPVRLCEVSRKPRQSADSGHECSRWREVDPPSPSSLLSGTGLRNYCGHLSRTQHCYTFHSRLPESGWSHSMAPT